MLQQQINWDLNENMIKSQMLNSNEKTNASTMFLGPCQYPIRSINVRSHEASMLQDLYLEFRIALKIDRHLGSTPADVPVKF